WLERIFRDESLITHRVILPEPPPLKKEGLSEIVEDLKESDERWWDETRRKAFLDQLSPVQQERVSILQERAKEPIYRTAYRRTRNGKPAWEIRADDIAGCLRTARGGSSKQAVVRLK